MRNQHPSEQVSTPKRRGRGCLVWLGGMVAALVGLMLLGALYESVAEAADARAYPLPASWSTWAAIGSTSTAWAPAVRPW